MRYLHPVSTHERFIASGIYTDYENGKPSGTVEEWSVHQHPDGSQLIRADRDARHPDETSLLLEAFRAANGCIERFDLHYLHTGSGPIKQAKATFVFFENYVQIGRTINAGERQQDEMALPAGAVIYPLMHVFGGPVIAQLAQRGGETVPVFSPWLSDPASADFLSGAIDNQAVKMLGTETLDVGGSTIQAQGYQLIGGDNRRYWLDEQDLAVRCVSQPGDEKERLTLLTRITRAGGKQ